MGLILPVSNGFFLSKMTADKKGSSMIGMKDFVLSNRGIIKSHIGFERKLLINIKHALSIDSRISNIISVSSLES